MVLSASQLFIKYNPMHVMYIYKTSKTLHVEPLGSAGVTHVHTGQCTQKLSKSQDPFPSKSRHDVSDVV